MVKRTPGLISRKQGELKKRARQIRMVLTDCDGVLTDGGVYYSARGEELRRFSVIDGMGVELLRLAGLIVGIVSGETSDIIRKRAKKLRIEIVQLGIASKADAVASILEAHGISERQLLYIGDDINDLTVMTRIHSTGITACPSNAAEPVRRVSHFHSEIHGGYGAFREIINWFFTLRGERIDSYPFITAHSKRNDA